MSARKKSPATHQKSKKKLVPPKKDSKKTSSIQKIALNIRANKLIVALVLIVILLLGALINQKYQDWDNAQMIKGLARDFPALVAEIELATGLDLEVKYECMKTEEKFTEGVNVCELIVFGVDENEAQVQQFYNAVLKNNNFNRESPYKNGEGYNFQYRNKNSCGFRTTRSIYGSCTIGIRKANLKLARELLQQ